MGGGTSGIASGGGLFFWSLKQCQTVREPQSHALRPSTELTLCNNFSNSPAVRSLGTTAVFWEAAHQELE